MENIIYGIRPVIEAVRSGKEIEKVFISIGLQGALIHELIVLLKENGITFQYVPAEKINHLSKRNNQGVVAYVSAIAYHSLEQIIPSVYEQGRVPFVLVLDRITDVRNLGAIARTAECAGVNAIIVPDKGSAQINSDAVKTSAGALHTVPVCRSRSLAGSLQYMKDSGLRIVGTSEKSEKLHFDADFSAPVAIILGSEEDGITPALLRLCDETIRIPLFGSVGSLNVSVSAGIVLYEVIRQRTI